MYWNQQSNGSRGTPYVSGANWELGRQIPLNFKEEMNQIVPCFATEQ